MYAGLTYTQPPQVDEWFAQYVEQAAMPSASVIGLFRLKLVSVGIRRSVAFMTFPLDPESSSLL